MTAASVELTAFRKRFYEARESLMPQLFARMSLGADSLAALQTRRLRELLACASQGSPFWAKKLRGVDPERFELSDLPRLPATTKSELMAELDLAFTDRRLNRELAEGALAATQRDVVPIFGEYLVQATGGSSGLRGVFVSDAATWAEVSGGAVRAMVTHGHGALVVGMVAAASPVHSTALGAALNEPDESPRVVHPAPVTLPLAEIVARLNSVQPQQLVGYPTVLARLAREQCEGRLRIAPASVVTTSEMATPELRAVIRDGFGKPVVDLFGTTEGLMGATEPGDSVFAFNSDTCIAELVDADEQPVPIGTACDHVLITNLANRVQPMIRYRIDDHFTRHPDSPAHGRLRATVSGRSGETLRWGALEIHALVIRAVLLKHPEVIDYQVRQTPCGVDVAIVAAGAADERRLGAELQAALAASGLASPKVSVAHVDSLDRDRATGKLRRFVPL